MTTAVTRATRRDLEQLVKIFSTEELERTPQEARWFVECYLDYHHVNIAKEKGVIRGACFWRIEGEVGCGLGWIENLWVDANHRRKGLGEKLLKKSISDMMEFYKRNNSKLRKIALTTQSYRPGAIRLYESLGFEKVARMDEMYDPVGHDFLYLLEV